MKSKAKKKVNLNVHALLQFSDLLTSEHQNNVNKMKHPAPPNKLSKQARCEPSCSNNDNLIKVRGGLFNLHENVGDGATYWLWGARLSTSESERL